MGPLKVRSPGSSTGPPPWPFLERASSWREVRTLGSLRLRLKDVYDAVFTGVGTQVTYLGRWE